MRSAVSFVSALGVVLAALAAWWLLQTDSAPEPDTSAVVDELPRAGAPGLQASVGRKPPGAATAKHGVRVFGTVTRGGAPVAARIEVHVLALRETGIVSWERDHVDRVLPAEGLLAGKPWANATAGADGAYVVDGLPAGDVEVVAIAEDGAVGARYLDELLEGQRARGDVRIRSGTETLRGRVAYADGRPFAGHVAVVQGPWAERPSRGMRLISTDAEGRYEAHGLEAGPATVTAFVDRRLRVTGKDVRLPFAGEHVMVVDADLVEVAGRVVAERDGAPIAGAEVVASLTSTGVVAALEQRTTADGEGRFRAFAVPGRSYVLARAPGWLDGRAYVTLETKEVRVPLVRAGGVRGRVVGDDGTPAAGAVVYAVTLGANHSPRHAVAGTDGRYAIEDAYPGLAMVCALGGGWISKGLAQASDGGFNPFTVLVVEGSGVVQDLVAERAARAEGRVLDAGGATVPGAVVFNEVQGDDFLFGGFDLEEAGTRTASREDGSFALDTLFPGFDVRLSAEGPDGSPGEAGPFHTEAGAVVRADVRLVSKSGTRFLDATVVSDEDGKPIAGARVWARAYTERRSDTAEATTGPDGRARVGPLPHGSMEGSASAEGAAWSSSVRLGVDEVSDVAWTFRMKKHVGIAGRVARADGSPAAGVHVNLFQADRHRGSTRTDHMGAFRFQNVAAGEYGVRAADEGGSTVEAKAVRAGDEDVRVTLPPPAHPPLRVRVLGLDGRPLADAVAEAADDARSYGARDLVDGEATFATQGSAVRVEVRGRARPGTAQAWGAFVEGPLVPTGKVVEVRAPPERPIAGVVKTPAGVGVRGVRLTAELVRETRHSSDATHATALTDDAGRFRLGGLGDLAYRIEIVAPPEFGSVPAVDTRGGTTDLEIVLPTRVGAAPRVVDAAGAPVRGATLHLYAAADDEEFEVRTDSRGIATVRGLRPDRAYRLDVQPPEDRLDLLTKEIASWTPSDEPIALPVGLTVAGVVRDASGAPVGGARVRVGFGSQHREGVTRPDGTFEVGQLPDGEVRLQASQTRPTKRSSAVVTARAGATGARLVLEAGVELVVRFTGWPAGRGGQAILAADGVGTGVRTVTVKDGTATFADVHPTAPCTVYASEPGAKLCAIRMDVVPSAGPVTIAMAPAASLRGRLIAPSAADDLDVHVDLAGIPLPGWVSEEREYGFEHVPEGTWPVTATGDVDGVALSGVARVATGTAVDIELR